MGDLNVDCGLGSNPNNHVINIANQFDMKQLVNSPTRVTTQTKSLMDVILSTNYEQHINTSVIEVSLSDHYCVTTELSIKHNRSQQTHQHVTFSDYKNFKMNEFVDDFKMQIDISDTNFDNSELEVRWR